MLMKQRQLKKLAGSRTNPGVIFHSDHMQILLNCDVRGGEYRVMLVGAQSCAELVYIPEFRGVHVQLNCLESPCSIPPEACPLCQSPPTKQCAA
jgi:hypothetical protein